MKIGVIQQADISNVRLLSGYPYFMMQSLSKHIGEVAFLGPDSSWPTQCIGYSNRAANKLSYTLMHRRITSDHNELLARRLGRVFSRRLAEVTDCDVLFAPNASVEIAYLSSQKPIVYYSDLNWADIVDYYPGCQFLSASARNQGEKIEQLALHKAKALAYPSEWAAKTAVEHYGVDSNRVHYVPYGANLQAEDIPSREQAVKHTLGDQVRLLWIGVDWQRKGGDIACACLQALLSRGIDATLTIAGCQPPEHARHPKMEVVGFLDKNDPAQRRKLSELFLGAHFLLFPTQAEGVGIVLCEASAYGLPSLVRNTGGVAGALHHGKNGYLMSANASGADYADKIGEMLGDPTSYSRMVQTSRDLFEGQLNWDAWGRSMRAIFLQVLQGDSKP